MENLRYRFKVISSRRSSPSLYNSEEEDTDMAHINPYKYYKRAIIQPILSKDLDDITTQRDDRDAQIVQLQQDINRHRQLDTLNKIILTNLLKKEIPSKLR
ncbi:2690_t:CDS:2 [Paraglomus occultum]|uniref:2690_t:CDS:1 n=1 Tax=Paraglomus occultum TaxID=144539 RepID=A0A9N9C675_9GLOM|nr:2690_t:CDS:2 [Paraglomus occultum]